MLRFTPQSTLPGDFNDRVQCPNCAEWIRFEAKMCPHCRSEDNDWKRGMITAISKKEVELEQTKSASTRAITIAIIVVALLLLLLWVR